MAGHGDGPRTKNGPALAGHGAEAVRDAITRAITTLPEQLRQSLTWDQGAEMAQHAQLRIEAGVAVYFCDPHSKRARSALPSPGSPDPASPTFAPYLSFDLLTPSTASRPPTAYAATAGAR